MREITNERGQCDEQQVTKRPQKIFDVVAEDKEEVNVADKMNDSGVQKKWSDKRQTVQARGFRRD